MKNIVKIGNEYISKRVLSKVDYIYKSKHGNMITLKDENGLAILNLEELNDEQHKELLIEWDKAINEYL